MTSEQVESYINGKIRNGENVTLVAENGDVLTLTADTAGKLADNHSGHGTTLTDEEFYVKANAAVHIDELAKISTRGNTKTDKGSRHGKFASGGWNYRTAYFRDFDGKYYRLQISVAQNTDGAVVYNIGKIDERSLPTVYGSSANGGAQGRKASSTLSLSENGGNVNSKNQQAEDVAPRSWQIKGEDVALAPVTDIAPVAEDTAIAEESSVAPAIVSNAESVPDDVAPWREQFESLTDEDAPPVADNSLPKKITTVQDRVDQKIQNAQMELEKNIQNREEAYQHYADQIAKAEAELAQKKNPHSKAAENLRRRIENLKRQQGDIDATYEKRISDLEKRIEKYTSEDYSRAEHRREVQSKMTQKWADLIGDTKTWKDLPFGLAYKTKTLRRILRAVVRDANGNQDFDLADAIYDELETKYDHHEAQLKVESGKLKQVFADLKLTSAEDTYAQMLGEFRHNPDTTLTQDAVDEYYQKHKGKIDTAKVDKAIAESRKLYDELIVRVNKVLKAQGMKEIPYRQGYFPHFTNPKQNWLMKVLNWKPVDTEIPTSIAGLTQDFKPRRSWQTFAQKRRGDTTDYSLYKGLDTYIHGALDWIYHIEDLQSRRSLENYIRFIHSDEGIQQRIKNIQADDSLDADEVQDQINAVLDEAKNPVSGLVRELMNRTNTLAAKKSSMDRDGGHGQS